MTVPGATPPEPTPQPTPGPNPTYPAAGYETPPQYAAPPTPQYGAPPAPQYPAPAPQYAAPAPQYGAPVVQYASRRNLLVATLLCFFLGGLGVHRFYVGKVGTGLLMLFTAGGLGVWWLIDFIMLLCQAFKDSEGYTLRWDTVH